MEILTLSIVNTEVENYSISSITVTPLKHHSPREVKDLKITDEM